MAEIQRQNYQSGGLPKGRNANITVNENGQESVLNNNATTRIGSRNIEALNRGASLGSMAGNGSQQTQNVEIYYSPTQTFTGGNSEDVVSALVNEREAFADFFEESIRKGVLNVG